MYKKCPCRRTLDKQQGKRSQTLLTPARQHLYHLSWSASKKLSWKKSLLYPLSSSVWRKFSWEKYLSVICKILRLFVKSLTADDKQFSSEQGNLRQPIQMGFSRKQKLFWEFFSAFLKWRSIFENFEKKWPSLPMYFRNYGLQKTLQKCVKGPVAEDPSTGKMVNGP